MTLGVLSLFLLSFVPTVAAAPAVILAAPVVASHPAAPSPLAAPAPSAASLPCAPVINGICVSMQNATEPQIVPTPPSYTAAFEPAANSIMPMWVKSAVPLNWTFDQHSGPNSPIALNVTGTLWDGTPYYTQIDGSTYHGPGAAWWSGPYMSHDPTYPYWYTVNISGTTSAGKAAFFPGMSITWWIEITFNVSGNYIHENGPQYHYTYKGAWPYSPYPGSREYGGAGAFLSDVTVYTSPSRPNWNDSFHLTVNTTPMDKSLNATLNEVYLDLTEVNANGTPIASATFTNAPSNGTLGVGSPSLGLTIPASFAQQAGSGVTYTLHASDAWGDWISSGLRSYTVGDNGSFTGLVFGNDLSLTTNPSVGLAPALPPGAPVNLTLVSLQPNVAIAAATVYYTVTLPVLDETTQFSSAFTRVNSTVFTGAIPGLPVGVGVNFSVTAWDFSSLGESSPNLNYSVLPLTTLLPSIAQNDSFFYVGVHGGPSGGWVSGAAVSIAGPGGYVATRTTTLAGLAYPGQAGAPLVPIIVPAGSSYDINVTDPSIGLTGITVTVAVTHTMGTHAVLASAADYSVIQNGDLVIFWLNATVAPPAASTSDLTPVLIGSGLGLGAAALIVIPLLGWWQRIQKRREEELKRVTL